MIHKNNKDTFWNKYPKDKRSFDKHVKKGVWIHITVDYCRGDGLQPEYKGKSLGKISNLAEIWVRSEIEILINHPRAVIDSIKQFIKDDKEDSQKAENALQKAKDEQMPIAPDGYYWELDNGGLRMKNVFSYRLWSMEFGYMPKSE